VDEIVLSTGKGELSNRRNSTSFRNIPEVEIKQQISTC